MTKNEKLYLMTTDEITVEHSGLIKLSRPATHPISKQSPILNHGIVVVQKDGCAFMVKIYPFPEDETGKVWGFNLKGKELHRFDGCLASVQYMAEYSIDEVQDNG